jgi:hypothetical protein
LGVYGWVAQGSLNLNFITAINEANSSTDWTTNDAVITVATSATANNGTYSLSFSQTAAGVDGAAQIQNGFSRGGTYAAGSYTLEFDVLVPVGANNVHVNFSNGNNGAVLNNSNRSFDGNVAW